MTRRADDDVGVKALKLAAGSNLAERELSQRDSRLIQSDVVFFVLLFQDSFFISFLEGISKIFHFCFSCFFSVATDNFSF